MSDHTRSRISYDDLTNNYTDGLVNPIPMLRYIFGLSQEKFGELLGVSRQTIYSWETGKTKPKKIHYVAMCEVLKMLYIMETEEES